MLRSIQYAMISAARRSVVKMVSLGSSKTAELLLKPVGGHSPFLPHRTTAHTHARAVQHARLSSRFVRGSIGGNFSAFSFGIDRYSLTCGCVYRCVWCTCRNGQTMSDWWRPNLVNRGTIDKCIRDHGDRLYNVPPS